MAGGGVGDSISTTDGAATNLRAAVTRIGQLDSALLQVAEGRVGGAITTTHLRVFRMGTILLCHLEKGERGGKGQHQEVCLQIHIKRCTNHVIVCIQPSTDHALTTDVLPARQLPLCLGVHGKAGPIAHGSAGLLGGAVAVCTRVFVLTRAKRDVHFLQPPTVHSMAKGVVCFAISSTHLLPSLILTLRAGNV